LGQGSFATVRRAVNKVTGEVVAVKIVLRKQAMMDDHTWELHVQEAEMLQKLKHPRIVRLIELFKREEELYMVTEFAAGGELFDCIVNDGVYNEEKAQLVMKRLCDAVQYLHSKGIVHRDLVSFCTIVVRICFVSEWTPWALSAPLVCFRRKVVFGWLFSTTHCDSVVPLCVLYSI
jgi:serine/threonine protein kinase